MKLAARVSGFTLIEVMVVVIIVGILASIAYPSYVEHVRKTQRAEARGALLEGAQALERYYSINGRYTTAANGTTLPSVFKTVVPDSGPARYNIAVSGTASTNSFTLRATRAGKMAGDACGDYSISSTGVLDVVASTNSKNKAECL